MHRLRMCATLVTNCLENTIKKMRKQQHQLDSLQMYVQLDDVFLRIIQHLLCVPCDCVNEREILISL